MDKTPRELAEQNLTLADEYGKIAERLADLVGLKAEWWKSFREDYKSDASAERSWDLTKEGQEMTLLKMKLKSKEKRMSANKTMIRVAENESYNQY